MLFFLWEHLKRQREREGRSKKSTWDKMKREIKRKYLPIDYKQDVFHKIHNFKHRELTVEDYMVEFDNIMLKGDLVELEEQTIARYLGDLRYDIANVVQLQP